MYIEDRITAVENRVEALEGMRIKHDRQPVSQELRRIIEKAEKTNNPFQVKFLKVEPTGFYHYEIKHKGNIIKFLIEPSLLPVYEFIVRDMMERHNKTPQESFVDNPDMKTPFTDIDDAVKKMEELIKKIDERRGADERQDCGIIK